ncbi:hypothetical protein Bca4012_085963 [Brassica carinata]
MSTSLCRVAEHGVKTAKAVEERPNYRPIIDHDGLPRQRLSNQTHHQDPISNGKERIANIRWRLEPIQIKESGMRNMIQALAHRDNRVTDHTSAVIEEMMNSKGPNDVATKRESYHQNHRSSREKSSSDYKTNRDDRYDSRQSKERRKQNSFEDRYNPLERD